MANEMVKAAKLEVMSVDCPWSGPRTATFWLPHRVLVSSSQRGRVGSVVESHAGRRNAHRRGKAMNA